ncbi:capsid protein [Mute swan feces associated circular virus 14]|uniref:capsid protein n=1 Tax=Mute swan feces associated circular virus 14 TaxID=2832264 RepID=UPI003A7A4F85|nr:capsid protein [Mute swan feces associated circular virus 14]
MYYRRYKRRLVTAGELKDRIEGAAESVNPVGLAEIGRGEVGYIADEQSRLVTPQSSRKKRKRDNKYSPAFKIHSDIHRERIKESSYRPKQIQFGRPQQRQRRPNMRMHKSTARASKYRANLGERKKHLVRKCLTKQTISQGDDKSLYAERVIRIPYDASEKVINRRNDLLVNVSGVRIRRNFFLRNFPVNDTKLRYPVTIRWAIINPKENNGSDQLDGGEFVRARNPTTSPYGSFPSGANPGDSFDLLSLKINSESFGVLKQGSFELRAQEQQIRYTGSTTKIVDVWIPLKREIHFADNETAFPEENLYFVWWYCGSLSTVTTKEYTGLNAQVAVFGEQTAYFTNSRLYN